MLVNELTPMIPEVRHSLMNADGEMMLFENDGEYYSEEYYQNQRIRKMNDFLESLPKQGEFRPIDVDSHLSRSAKSKYFKEAHEQGHLDRREIIINGGRAYVYRWPE